MEITATSRNPAIARTEVKTEKKARAKFAPAPVFGKMLYDRTIGWLVVKSCAYRERHFAEGKRENLWEVWDTPLSKYTHTHETDELAFLKFEMNPEPGKKIGDVGSFLAHVPEDIPDFEKFVNVVMADAIAKKGEFRILVVGGCTGNALRELANCSGVKLDFTVLAMGTVTPDMRKFAYECNAAQLHKFFPDNYYDVAVSHFSLYGQRKIGLANMLHVTAPGGHIVVASKNAHSSPKRLLKNGDGTAFDLIRGESSDDGMGYFFHLKKF